MKMGKRWEMGVRSGGGERGCRAAEGAEEEAIESHGGGERKMGNENEEGDLKP